MNYSSLTYLEIREYAQAGCMAVIPTGCTEQQGPHLALDFDTWFSEAVCLAVAHRMREQNVHAAVLLKWVPNYETRFWMRSRRLSLNLPNPI